MGVIYKPIDCTDDNEIIYLTQEQYNKLLEILDKISDLEVAKSLKGGSDENRV